MDFEVRVDKIVYMHIYDVYRVFVRKGDLFATQLYEINGDFDLQDEINKLKKVINEANI